MSESMRNYEITFIVDPVLSGDEIKATAQTYVDYLKDAGCNIVHVDEMGLRQLAYPINKRTSGVYFSVEFTVEAGEIIDELELTLRRDERVIRFLTVKLDKYGVKYNDDKRNGKIAKFKKPEKSKPKDNRDNRRRDRRDRDRDNRSGNRSHGGNRSNPAPKSQPTPKAESKPKPEPAAKAPAKAAVKEEEE